MGVYIKGMEMPKSCFDCPLSYVFPYSEDNFMVKCAPLNRKSSEDTKRNDCPLIEVPTPHGRLIDADALMKQYAEKVRPSNNSDFISAPLWNDAVQLTEYAPTIIESEE